MGDRYIISVECPKCDEFMDDVYFAPTRDFITKACDECGHIIDLVEYTGITCEDASNADVFQEILNEVREEWANKKAIE